MMINVKNRLFEYKFPSHEERGNDSRYSFKIDGVLAMIIFMIVMLSPTHSFADPLQKYFEKGNKAYENGDYSTAISYYEKAVEVDPNYAPVYNALGLTYSQMKSKSTDVVWFFNVATEIDPQYAEAYNNLCRIYLEAKEYANAEQACLKALSINPEMGSAKLSLAWIYLFGISKPNEAIQYFVEVLDKVKNPKIYWGLGMAYVTKNDHAHVLEVITTLRGMQEDQLAMQLEKAIRPKGSEMPRQEAVEQPVERQPAKLIPANPEPNPMSPSEKNSSSVSGGMRVRLKGRLTDVAGPTPGVHPGSLNTDSSSRDYSSPTQQKAQSALEKIRQMQWLRQKSGVRPTPRLPGSSVQPTPSTPSSQPTY